MLNLEDDMPILDVSMVSFIVLLSYHHQRRRRRRNHHEHHLTGRQEEASEHTFIDAGPLPNPQHAAGTKQ